MPIKTRGRPRKQIDEALLDAAIDEFLLHGYNDANLDRIAAAGGSTKPALYRRYTSKESLFEAALWHFANEFQPDLSCLEGDRAPADALYDLALLFHDKLGSAKVIASTRLGAAESARFPALIMRFRERIMSGFIPRMAAYFSDLDARGILQIVDTQDAAIIFTSLTGRPFDRVLGAVVDDRQLEAHLRELVRFFMAGYAPRPT